MVAALTYAQKRRSLTNSISVYPVRRNVRKCSQKVEGAKVNVGDANISEIEHYGVKDYFEGCSIISDEFLILTKHL